MLCAELCGTGHGFMRGIVMVDTTEDYQAWLQEQSTFAQLRRPSRWARPARSSNESGGGIARIWHDGVRAASGPAGKQEVT